MKHSENPIADLLYSNPETTATVAGLAAPAAAAIGTGYLAGGLFGGSQTQSMNTLPVQGNPHLGSTGNPNIDTINASLYADQQRYLLKLQHAKALQELRADASTPSNQPYGGVSGSIPGIDQDLASVGRSIFGTGLRA